MAKGGRLLRVRRAEQPDPPTINGEPAGTSLPLRKNVPEA